MSKGLAFLLIAAALFVGGVGGFSLGVATSDFVQGLTAEGWAVEEEADLEHAVQVETAGFRFTHPGNWRYDLEAGDHDPGHYFMLDSPGGSYVEVSFEPEGAVGQSPADALEDNLTVWTDHYRDAMDGISLSPFDRYGALKGKGNELRGRYYGSKVTARVFSYADEARTLVVVEYVYEPDRELVEPGFALIRESFALR